MIKIISGGQTGADTGGLKAAHALGYKTGGHAAKGFITENGVNFDLRDKYGLSDKCGFSYAERTRENVKMSNVTFIFADYPRSAGTQGNRASVSRIRNIIFHER